MPATAPEVSALSALISARDQFRAVASNAQDQAIVLDDQIKTLEAQNLTQKREGVLKAIGSTAKQALARSEVVFMIQMTKSADYTEGGFVGKAFTTAYELKDAASTVAGAKISAFGFGRADILGLDLDKPQISIVENALTKEDEKLGDRRALPLAKELLKRNMPDVAGDCPRHYVAVVSASGPSDDIGQTVAIINAALGLNKNATLDLIVCGENGTDSVLDKNSTDSVLDKNSTGWSAVKNVKGVSVHEVQNNEQLGQTLSRVLGSRLRLKMIPESGLGMDSRPIISGFDMP